MNIIIGKNSGFCAGVKYTVTKAEKELDKEKNGLDCLGEIIHNNQVIDILSKKGLRTIDSIENAKNKVIIRAHGVSKDVYNYAKENKIELIDLTCPNVLKIHDQVQKYSNDNYFIFLLGIKNHPETIGTYSFCSKNCYLIENISDIDDAIINLKNSNLKNLLIISQTTFSVKLFDEIVSEVLKRIGKDYNIHVEKSICNATDLRQQEAKEISSKVDLMIIIGGKNSSNTKKLYEVSKINCENVIHIETKNDLDAGFIKNFKNIGIIAGASTPDFIINEVVDFCNSL